jgi:N-acyl-D-amino-acid deacylase
MKKINRRKFIENTTLLTASGAMLGSIPLSNIMWKGNSFDLIVRNGSIIDGTGKNEFIADIGIKDGKLAAIEYLTSATADRIIDAKGLKVCPGFIDIHSHTDLDLIPNPKAESKIRQGVTTEVCGQDGSSYGPYNLDTIAKTKERFAKSYGEEMDWDSLGGFLDSFAKRDFCLNLASMVGLGTIRAVVMGYDDRPASTDEIKRMQYEVEKAIAEGAIGISTGLEYTPGSFASTEELIKCCKAAPLNGRLYATHMRNEDNTVVEAVEEAIRIARESGGRLQISHLKVSGKTNWHKADKVLSLIDAAINEGIETHADRYTYVAYHTGLANLFPLWSRDGGNKKFLERLKNPSLIDSMKNYSELKVNNLDGGWDGVMVSSMGNKKYKHYQGMTIKGIAEELGTDGFEATRQVILESNNSVMMVGFGMEEESTIKIIKHPHCMIASDGGSHAPYPPMNKSIAHPRSYGTFPRAIAHYQRDLKICSLEEMIKKMTSMPADKLGIKDRGRLEKGKHADVVLFDYANIKDKAVFTEPHQYPEGIPYVIVNGKIVIEKGEHTGAMPGLVIKS